MSRTLYSVPLGVIWLFISCAEKNRLDSDIITNIEETLQWVESVMLITNLWMTVHDWFEQCEWNRYCLTSSNGKYRPQVLDDESVIYEIKNVTATTWDVLCKKWNTLNATQLDKYTISYIDWDEGDTTMYLDQRNSSPHYHKFRYGSLCEVVEWDSGE